MKKSEFTDEWQDVLIPARARLSLIFDCKYEVRHKGSGYGETIPFSDPSAYRRFILVPKGAKVTVVKIPTVVA